MKTCYFAAEPAILTQNCYFWNPCGNASGRRRNEEKKNEEVESFLSSLPDPEKHGLTVSFSYSESCKHVYKSFTVHRTADGSKTNIKTFRKLYTEEGRKQLIKEHKKRLAARVATKLTATPAAV